MKEGDEVTWTHVYRTSRSGFTMTTRRARIIHLTSRNVAVKYRGKLINLHPDQVRLVGQRTALTEAVMNMSA